MVQLVNISSFVSHTDHMLLSERLVDSFRNILNQFMISPSSLLLTGPSFHHQVSILNLVEARVCTAHTALLALLVISSLTLFLIHTAKHHPSQMRPRSRCLTVVHKEILNDVVSTKYHFGTYLIIQAMLALRRWIPYRRLIQ